MKDEIANVIRERTGLDEAIASQVADVVIEFLKSRLPEPIASMLDGNADLSQAAGLMGNLGNLGGLFGKRE
ncbi:MAG: hypothetical protein ACKVVP_09965 [Chloroflexota bacterium]